MSSLLARIQQNNRKGNTCRAIRDSEDQPSILAMASLSSFRADEEAAPERSTCRYRCLLLEDTALPAAHGRKAVPLGGHTTHRKCMRQSECRVPLEGLQLLPKAPVTPSSLRLPDSITKLNCPRRMPSVPCLPG
ncbi:hypothetical protein CB1_001907075 [Camelus ferus]|nr:hypothetical protein CB1_001907075 [Camelus ferus]